MPLNLNLKIIYCICTILSNTVPLTGLRYYLWQNTTLKTEIIFCNSSTHWDILINKNANITWPKKGTKIYSQSIEFEKSDMMICDIFLILFKWYIIISKLKIGQTPQKNLCHLSNNFAHFWQKVIHSAQQ